MTEVGATVKPMVRLPKHPNDCIEWIGQLDKDGRAIKCVGGKKKQAPRWVWEMFFGTLTKQYVVIQKCGNARCVNLFHLRAICHAECAQMRSSLTPGDVSDIRAKAKAGVPYPLICEQFGITNSAISKILKRQRWKRTAPKLEVRA